MAPARGWRSALLAACILGIARPEDAASASSASSSGSSDAVVATSSTTAAKDLDELNEEATCVSCLAKGGGWCVESQRCGEDDTAYCDADGLIGLAGFSNDCGTDEEAKKPKGRRQLDKGVLVSYKAGSGVSRIEGMGIIHRAYHVLEEYTVLLKDGSKEEVKTHRWEQRPKVKKGDENSEYHDIEFQYFKPSELQVLSHVRAGDLVQAHFAVKGKGLEGELVKSKKTEEALVINVTVATIAVNYTSDLIVSILPRDFVVGGEQKASHEEL